MKTDDLINVGAIAFAVFAVYVLTRGGSMAQARQPVSTQPGQIARDYGAQDWMDTLTQQWANLYPELPQATYDETERLAKRYPAPVTSEGSY